MGAFGKAGVAVAVLGKQTVKKALLWCLTLPYAAWYHTGRKEQTDGVAFMSKAACVGSLGFWFAIAAWWLGSATTLKPLIAAGLLFLLCGWGLGRILAARKTKLGAKKDGSDSVIRVLSLREYLAALITCAANRWWLVVAWTGAWLLFETTFSRAFPAEMRLASMVVMFGACWWPAQVAAKQEDARSKARAAHLAVVAHAWKLTPEQVDSIAKKFELDTDGNLHVSPTPDAAFAEGIDAANTRLRTFQDAWYVKPDGMTVGGETVLSPIDDEHRASLDFFAANAALVMKLLRFNDLSAMTRAGIRIVPAGDGFRAGPLPQAIEYGGVAGLDAALVELGQPFEVESIDIEPGADGIEQAWVTIVPVSDETALSRSFSRMTGRAVLEYCPPEYELPGLERHLFTLSPIGTDSRGSVFDIED